MQVGTMIIYSSSASVSWNSSIGMPGIAGHVVDNSTYHIGYT